MKLAYVLNTYPQPSHSFIRRELAALEAEGVAVTRLAMRRSDVALVDPLDKAEAARCEYVLDAGGLRLLGGLIGTFLHHPGRFLSALRLAMRSGRASPLGRMRHLIYLAEAAHVARRCGAIGVAHVHAHFGTNAATVAMLSHALGGPGYSFTVHGPEEFDAPRALSLPDKIARAAFTVAVSQFGRSQLCRWVEYAHWDRLKVVHCGIEPGKFQEVAALPDGPLRLVSIGRFSEQKGQMGLLEAMAQLPADMDVHLTLVGDGEMRADLERAIARLGLSARITLTGWLAEAEVLAALDAAHVMVLPSFAEGLPMVIMEAMAAGRPVLATYVAGIPELVLAGETGWLVPAGDVSALTQAICDVAAMPVGDLAAMGQAGRARVLARHDAAREAAKLLSHIQTATRR